jgi:hypothetical protein
MLGVSVREMERVTLTGCVREMERVTVTGCVRKKEVLSVKVQTVTVIGTGT